MIRWLTNQFIRALHVAVCLSLMLPILLRPSALHRLIFQHEDVIHGALYLGFFTAALCAYFVASYTDPGYLTHDKARMFRQRRGPSFQCEGDTAPTEYDGQFSDPRKPLSIDTKQQGTNLSNSDPTYVPSWPIRWLFLHPFSCWTNHHTTSEENGLQSTTVYNLSIPVRYCNHCLMEQPLRCRHCPSCARCVMKFDHHCPWIANCVGERNHSAFVVFLALQTIVLWWTVYFASASIVPRYSWPDWFHINGLFFAEQFILVLLGIPLTCLLGFHLYLASASRTTWETVSYERIVYLKHLEDRVNPFNQGYAKNCYSFCCSRFPFGWDRVYAETLEKQLISSPRSDSLANTSTSPSSIKPEVVVVKPQLSKDSATSFVEVSLNPV